MNHGFIGFGHLANAIYEGLREEEDLRFGYFARNDKQAGLPFFVRLEDLLAFSDVIWLTIKPQDLSGILQQLQSFPYTDKVFVSPVAGKSIAFIERYLNKSATLVRIMPNMAVAYRKSVTAFATNRPDDEKVQAVYHTLASLGKVVRLEEDQFDLFTAVFGSGPAFILAYLKAFKDKIRAFDLPETVLDALVLELSEGTLRYYSEGCRSQTLEELIGAISSKGGTTQAGLDYFRDHRLAETADEMLEAARKRSEEMGRG